MSSVARRAFLTLPEARLGSMEPHMRWSRPVVGLGLILSGSMLAGCASTGAAPTTGASLAEPSMAPTEGAAATPAPTDMLTISIAFLPTPSVDTSKVKLACDASTLGASATMSCADIVKLTARVAATMSKNPIEQVAVAKSADNPSAIEVTFWVKSEDGKSTTVFTSTIDPANETVTFPIEDASAVFPTTS